MTVAYATLKAPVQAPRAARSARRSGIWRAYLVLTACLVPLCVPAGPGQTAALDFVNVFALVAFAFLLLSPRAHLHVPMLVPVCFVAAGSMLAMWQAASILLGTLALAQDVYLFAWFVLMVNLVRTQSELDTLRRAWMWTAVVVALWALAQLVIATGSLSGLLGSRGLRPSSTLYNPNMLADYLVASLFISASAARGLPLPVRLGVFGSMLLGLLATKSNGGMIALASGSVVWLFVRAFTRRTPLPVVAATTAFVLSVGGLGLWLHGEWGVGDSLLATLSQHTFAGRMEHSSESRMHIWEQLERSYARSPLGIGPGNTGTIQLGIAERERPGSYQSKEAHSDYLAFAIERGPLAVIGLLVMTWASFSAVARYWRLTGTGASRRRGAGTWTAGMAAALTATAVHSLVIEKLHFRHFWLLLAMVCASALIAERRARPARAARPPVPLAHGAPAGQLAPARVPGRLPRGRS